MRILIADKDVETLALSAARLKSRHYDVEEYSESNEVMQAIQKGSYDLLLLSTNMERVSGKLIIEKIRKLHHVKMVPIIMMTTEDEISELILSQERGFDDFLIKPFNPLVLQLRVAISIARVQIRSEANALTHLPGNITIEKEIRQRIECGKKFSVLYIDINQFKSFNDRYGFEKGDDAIRQTARLMLQTKDNICPDSECFVGHIGGDDFLVITEPEKEEAYAKAFIDEFDRIMPTYYSEADQKKGSIEVTNRRGAKEIFPIMSCAVAACTNLYRHYKNLGEISQDAAELKSFLKSQPGSNYLRDRRSSPMQELEQAAHILEGEIDKDKRKQGSVDPLGKILLNAGLINEDELSRAIKQHMLTGQRLGQTMISMNLVKSEDVGKMLQKKLNVPYVSLRSFKPSRDMKRLFTFEFMRSHRVAPIEVSGDTLKLAMCDPFDLKTLDAIEDISGLKPVPCLALEDEFEEFIDNNIKKDQTEELYG